MDPCPHSLSQSLSNLVRFPRLFCKNRINKDRVRGFISTTFWCDRSRQRNTSFAFREMILTGVPRIKCNVKNSFKAFHKKIRLTLNSSFPIHYFLPQWWVWNAIWVSKHKLWVQKFTSLFIEARYLGCKDIENMLSNTPTCTLLLTCRRPQSVQLSCFCLCTTSYRMNCISHP